jgi:AraC family transcriptional regulator
MANKQQTIDDHRERLNRVLVFLQDNIDRPLKLKQAAGIAHFSPFHFHRIFSAHVGETLSEHIRRLRLHKAANKLYYSGETITQIALAAGYETPAAFTRAFRQHFGRNPTEFKKGMKETLPARMQFLPGGRPGRRTKPMKCEMRTLPEQQVLFVRKTGRYDKAAAEAWSALMHFAYSRRLMKKDTKGIGISHDSPDITPEEKIRYDACITFTGAVKPEGEVGLQTIAGGRYAVFLHKGPYKNFSKTYNYIMAQWYPESGKKFRDLPCFEIYLNRDPRRTKPENLRTEIFVPIK